MVMEENSLKAEEEEESPGKMTLPQVLTYDEIDRLMLAINDIEDLIAVRLMLFGGLRVSEARKVKPSDISPERMAVLVRQGKGGKDRWAPLDTATIALIRCHPDQDEPLFSRTKRTLQRRVSELYQRAGITWGATCHTLRHTCATWQLDMGIPLEVVRENLGHSDISITQIYLHLNIRQRSRLYRDATRFGT